MGARRISEPLSAYIGRRPARRILISRHAPSLPVGSPTTIQMAVPAQVQQLSALSPNLERGGVSVVDAETSLGLFQTSAREIACL